MITLNNPTTANIIDYRIEEPQLTDDEGRVLIQGKTESNYPKVWEMKPPPIEHEENLFYKTTSYDAKLKRSKLWTIKAGETITVPDYVAKILLDRFGFLKKT